MAPCFCQSKKNFCRGMFLWYLRLECGYIDLSNENDNTEFGDVD